MNNMNNREINWQVCSPVDIEAEIKRLNKIIRVLMDRAEHASNLQGSAFNLFETAIVLEEQVSKRTRELEAALEENKKITRALQQAKEQMEGEINQRVQVQQELEVANNKLLALNITDQLTELLNRRGLDELLSAEWQRSLVTGRCLGIAMIDIDNFKGFNDCYGHLAGDKCLKRVAEALQKCVRNEDLVARYGGEEIVMVLPGADSHAAYQVAERARAAVEAMNIPNTGTEKSVVTVSIGVVTRVPRHSSSPTELLNMADVALYEAKSSGRNCVKMAE